MASNWYCWPPHKSNNPIETNPTYHIHTMKQFTLATTVLFSIAVATEAFAPHTLRWRQALAINQQNQIVEQRMMTLHSQKDDDDLRQAEDDAAFDAHDCPDAGMEAAAEERAVMMAESMHLKPKHEIHAEQTSSADESVPAPHISMDKVGDAEVKQAEEDAAYDAHDCSDAGMEAAAEEFAVMMAYEMAEKKKEEARKQSD